MPKSQARNQFRPSATVLEDRSVPSFAGANFVYGSNEQTRNLVVGQFAGDGLSDMAYVSGNAVHVLRNDGGSSFSKIDTALDVSTVIPGSTLSGLWAADFNGDGKADLLVSTGAALHTFLGNGNATFTASATSPVYVDTPTVNELAIGKVNADTSPDIVLSVGDVGANEGKGVALLGNGDGSFARVDNVYPNTALAGLRLGDFNGDGKADVAGRTAVQLGDGTGKFPTAHAGSPYAIPADAVALAAGNFTGSAATDIAFYATVGGVRGGYVLEGGPSGMLLVGGGDSFAANLDQSVSADFDFDGTDDYLLASQFPGAGAFRLLYGNATNVFRTPSEPHDVSAFHFPPVVGSFTAPGSRDVIIPYFGGGVVLITPEQGLYLFRNNVTPPVSNDFHTTTTVSILPNPVAAGQPVTISATVTSPAGIPTGTVTFRQAGGGILGFPDRPLVNGQASVSESFPVANPVAVYATFYPTGSFLGSQSETISILVGSGSSSTTQVIGLHPNAVRPGESFTATVRVTPAGGTLTGGTVQVFVGGVLVGSAPVGAGGEATVTASVTAVPGNYVVTATYSGFGTVAGSQALDGPDLTVLPPLPPPPPPILPPPPHLPAPPIFSPLPPAAPPSPPRRVLALGSVPSPARPRTNGEAAQTVWLNFNGATVEHFIHAYSVLDMPAFQTGDLSLAATVSRDDLISEIVLQLQAIYFPYDVDIVTDQPASGEYMTAVIGGDINMTYRQVGTILEGKWGTKNPTVSQVLADGGGLFGIAERVDVGNVDRSDVALVFSAQQGASGLALADTEKIRTFVYTLAHEIGHNVGLRHIVDPNSIMTQFGPITVGAAFFDDPFPVSESSWWFDKGAENSVYELMHFVGAFDSATWLTRQAEARPNFFGIPLPSFLGGHLYNATITVQGDGESSELDFGKREGSPQFVIVVPEAIGVLNFSLAKQIRNPRISIQGASRPGGPIDVFSGVATNGRLTEEGSFVSLYDAAGGFAAIPMLTGEQGNLVSAGTTRAFSRNGFATSPYRAVVPTSYFTGSDAGGRPLVMMMDARNGQEYGRFLAFEESFTGGVRVASGDVNGDGIADVVVGTGVGGAPRIRVFDGATLTSLDGPLGDFFAYEDTFRGGVNVAVGDVDGDGYMDVIAGAGVGGAPRVRVFSGRDGAILADFFAYEDTARGGVTVAAADIDGDGKWEVITGAGVGGAPRVRVFTLGADGPVATLDFFAYEESARGGVNVAAADIDGDGKAEVVSGAGVGGSPRVRAFDQAGNEAANFFAYEDAFRGGVRVGVTDADADGVAELVVAPGPGGGPRVRVVRPKTTDVLFDDYAFDPTFTGGVYIG